MRRPFIFVPRRNLLRNIGLPFVRLSAQVLVGISRLFATILLVPISHLIPTSLVQADSDRGHLAFRVYILNFYKYCDDLPGLLVQLK